MEVEFWVVSKSMTSHKKCIDENFVIKHKVFSELFAFFFFSSFFFFLEMYQFQKSNQFEFERHLIVNFANGRCSRSLLESRLSSTFLVPGTWCRNVLPDIASLTVPQKFNITLAPAESK